MLLYFCNPRLDGLKNWTTKHEMGLKQNKNKTMGSQATHPYIAAYKREEIRDPGSPRAKTICPFKS